MKPVIEIQGVISTSSSDELDKGFVLMIMTPCCNELGNRDCPVLNRCLRFYDRLNISARTYFQAVEDFNKIKRERDRRLKHSPG